MMAMRHIYRKRHLVFDLDGTLIDSAPDIARAVNGLMAELGLPELPVELARRMIGEGAPVFLKRALEWAGSDADPETLLERYATHYDANTRGLTTLYPGVIETLAALAEADCRFALCTNKPYRATLDVLEGFGLDRFFTAVVAGDSMAERKPSPEPLLEAIRMIGGDVASSVLIGDSAVDLATAMAARVPAIIIPSGYGMKPVEGALMVSDFASLPGVLARL
jgi:phosphoglycolate phosphatase